MRISDRGLSLIKTFEGLYLTAYQCPAGKWTIGWGCTDGVTPGMTITEAQAEAWLKREVAQFEGAVSAAVTVPLNQHEFDALVSFAYNVGAGALRSSTLLKKLNSGDRAGAAKEFDRWNRGGGRVLPGLVRRRAAERELFLEPMPVAVSMAAPATPSPSGAIALEAVTMASLQVGNQRFPVSAGTVFKGRIDGDRVLIQVELIGAAAEWQAVRPDPIRIALTRPTTLKARPIQSMLLPAAERWPIDNLEFYLLNEEARGLHRRRPESRDYQ